MPSSACASAAAGLTTGARSGASSTEVSLVSATARMGASGLPTVTVATLLARKAATRPSGAIPFQRQPCCLHLLIGTFKEALMSIVIFAPASISTPSGSAICVASG
jgi:hypothetical protein